VICLPFTIPKWFIIVLLTLLLGFQPSKVQDFATIHNSVNICFWDYSDYVGIWWELVGIVTFGYIGDSIVMGDPQFMVCSMEIPKIRWMI